MCVRKLALVIKTDDLSENLEAQLQDTIRLLKAWKRCSYCGNENLKAIVLAPNGEIVCKKCGTVLGRTFLPSVSDARVKESSEPLCDEERTLEDHVSRYGWNF